MLWGLLMFGYLPNGVMTKILGDLKFNGEWGMDNKKNLQIFKFLVNLSHYSFQCVKITSFSHFF